MELVDVMYTKRDGIAEITINRPKVLNAFRDQTIDELTFAFDDANNDETIGVIVLSGNGGKAFCTGGDVGMENELNPKEGRKLFRRISKLSQVMRDGGKPIIAKVRGYCVGGGNELNMLCDLTIASENSKFAQVGPKMGSVPIWYGIQSLIRAVGEKRAREIVYLCHMYTAQEALEMGWINQVVTEDKLDEAVEDWCQELLDKSPQALRIAKYVANYESDQLYPSVISGFQMVSMAHGTEEFKEGTKAFLEKRKPNFRQFRR